MKSNDRLEMAIWSRSMCKAFATGEVADGLSADDFVYEVGTGGIADGADEELRGKKAGDIVEIDAPQLQGGAGKLRLLVKQVREKLLPEANDEWASDASEFDTLEELRSHLTTASPA